MSIPSVTSASSMLSRAGYVSRQSAKAETAQAAIKPEQTNDAGASRRAAVSRQAAAARLEATGGSTVVAMTPDGAAVAAKLAAANESSSRDVFAAKQHSATQPMQKSDAVAEADDPPASGDMLTLKGLIAAWGQTDSPYDLTGDGTVDMSDLLTLLQNGGTMPMPEGAQEPLTLKGLLAAWGSGNSTFDLNADGIVDVTDLLAFLAKSDPDAGSKMKNARDVSTEQLVSMVQANPAATDQNVADLMSLLGEDEAA